MLNTLILKGTSTENCSTICNTPSRNKNISPGWFFSMAYLDTYPSWEKMENPRTNHGNSYPRCSMYGMFTYICVIYGVNVGKYSMEHLGMVFSFFPSIDGPCKKKIPSTPETSGGRSCVLLEEQTSQC